jgi:acetylornithine/succinyldiaminopimelate/putrescine aminotransferase
MGEGDPGRRITREFYDEARKLTSDRETFLIVDSVQAGLRATGELSLVDWPGFGTCDPPDFEVFSKALNGGQFPLSVVAFSERARSAYVTGIYGNTMSFNPKAARVGCGEFIFIFEWEI